MRRVLQFVFFVCLLAAAAPAHAVDFLIPGLEVGRLRFQVGSWVRYLSGTMAEGQSDTSIVLIGVVGSEGSDLYWVEFVSETPGMGPESRVGVRFLIDQSVIDAGSRDEVIEKVHRIIVQRGLRPPEEEALESLENEKLVPVFERSAGEDRLLEEETLPVGGSVVHCRHRLVVSEESKEIPLGKRTLERTERTEAHTWVSEQVPFWGLVKSSSLRRSEARTKGGQPFPGMGVKETRVWARLLDYGAGLEPTIPLPPPRESESAGSPR